MAEVDHEVVIAADHEESEDSQSEGGQTVSSTSSLSSSIHQHRLENGRTYHRYKDGNFQHDIFLYTIDDKLGLAPPCAEDAKVGRVLDVGTGTGSWAMDFGDLHPEAEVIGVDLSPARAEFVPPNVRFEVDDLEEEWTYSLPFEYIHSRFMTASINNWKEYIQKCYKSVIFPCIRLTLLTSLTCDSNLTPGGYLELQDADVMPRSDDNLLPKDAAIIKYVDMLKEASEKSGREYVEVSSLKNLMIEAGFVDVEMQMYKWPHNEWPKEPRYKKLGYWTQENFGAALEAICMAPFTRVLNWTRDEVNVFLIDVRKDLKNKSYHAYCPVYCIFGRKPEKEDTPAPPQPESQ
ncbi:TAM domain methyltransferase [Colletotrichum higginsianum IMI 349063]|uniref:TAM domain methyltransferase n=1 Tax=Colletotrichum higginsianum (strain IMI 349063) TaxID=759273 RepID=A0A1B7YUE0_COLHI|nr:TAM domain methyltransferase [Colletotrichum higginsianum IMI 349063]OBR15657.1 TAM domain methyltransferase [Colletotrichum higginsianum IMI 349063]